MKEDAQFGRAASVRFERLLPGPIGRLWEYLVDTGRLPGWYGEGTIEPGMGGAVSLMGGHVHGVVTEWKPPHRLTYTWNVQPTYPESYVSIELQPRAEDVLLILTHLPVLERFEKQNAMGWHTYLDMLSAGVRGETVQDRGVYMRRNAERYGVDLNNLQR